MELQRSFVEKCGVKIFCKISQRSAPYVILQVSLESCLRKFSKSRNIGILYSECSDELTFENFVAAIAGKYFAHRQ